MPYLDYESLKDLKERSEYISGIHTLIDGERKKARTRRLEYTLTTPEDERREALRRALGFPLCPSLPKNEIAVRKTHLVSEDKFDACRMQLEIANGLWLYGILLEPKVKKEKNALVVFQHGGWGYPEIASGLVPPTNYHNIAQETLEDGVYIFCPQIPYWRPDVLGSDYSREEIDLSLRRLGGSLAALCVFGISRALDYFLSLPDIDPDRVGMAGLSYGGMYTLLSAALDTRIRFSLSSCFFNDRGKYVWQDMVYFGGENVFFDSEILTLVSPRPIFLEIAKNDEIFSFNGVEKAIDDYNKYKTALSLTDNAVFHVFNGRHEFATDGEGLNFLKKRIRKEGAL